MNIKNDYYEYFNGLDNSNGTNRIGVVHTPSNNRDKDAPGLWVRLWDHWCPDNFSVSGGIHERRSSMGRFGVAPGYQYRSILVVSQISFIYMASGLIAVEWFLIVALVVIMLVMVGAAYRDYKLTEERRRYMKEVTEADGQLVQAFKMLIEQQTRIDSLEAAEEKNLTKIAILTTKNQVLEETLAKVSGQMERVASKVETAVIQNGGKLAVTIAAHFEEEELEELVYAMGIPWGEITGRGIKAKCRALVGYCRRRDRTLDLYDALEAARPHIAW